MDVFFKTLNRMRIVMSDRQTEELVELIMDVHNNTCLPDNRGYTPNELAFKRGGLTIPESITVVPDMGADYEDDEMDMEQLSQEFFESEMPERLKTQLIKELSNDMLQSMNLPKIGRNDPCPCGSGKKHKKCCGRYS